MIWSHHYPKYHGIFFPLQVLCTSYLSPSPMQSHLKMRSIRPTSALFPFNIPTDLLIGSEKFSVIARHSYSAYLSSEHLGGFKGF